MMLRLLIATVVTTTALTSVAWQQAGTRRPQRHLLLFTDLINCPPCRDFDRDYKSDANFRNALNRDYQLHQPYTPQRDQAEFRRHSVGKTPTWLIMDSAGKELGRVSGYAGAKDFWERLCLATPVNRPPATPPAEDSPSIRYRDDILQMGTPEESEFLQRLRSANRELEQQRDDLSSRIRTLEQDISKLRSQPQQNVDSRDQLATMQDALRSAQAALAKTQTQMQQETAALREQLRRAAQAAANAQAETERLNERLQQPPATPHQTPPTPPPDDWLEDELRAADKLTTPSVPDTAEISTEISRSGDRWAALLRTAGKAVVSIAAPELAIPLGIAAGAFAWFRKKKTRTPHRPTLNADADSLPRDNSEIEQILSLRQQEQREPIHDAFFGVLFEDEYRTNPDQPIRQAWTNALDRFNRTAPLSTRTETSTSTTNRNE